MITWDDLRDSRHKEVQDVEYYRDRKKVILVRLSLNRDPDPDTYEDNEIFLSLCEGNSVEDKEVFGAVSLEAALAIRDRLTELISFLQPGLTHPDIPKEIREVDEMIHEVDEN
jgi:hypothetical protein